MRGSTLHHQKNATIRLRRMMIPKFRNFGLKHGGKGERTDASAQAIEGFTTRQASDLIGLLMTHASNSI